MSDYTKVYVGGFVNEEVSRTTPIDGDALNHMETGIDTAHSELDTEVTARATADTAVANASIGLAVALGG